MFDRVPQRPDPALEAAISGAAQALLTAQREDGHWVYQLEADATIPAEFVLLLHYLDERDPELEAKIGNYLREIQDPNHHGWPLFHRGDLDISASVKAYFALKAIGDSPDAPHMVRAREAILKAGGAEKSNVFTRTLLALYGEIPWTGCPVMPVEIMLLPQWFPFHLSKVSYWSRTVIVPLLVLMSLRPRARNPLNIRIQELFNTPPEQVKDWPVAKSDPVWGPIFRALDKVLHATFRFFPKGSRDKAVRLAREWVDERLNGEDGLGAIYPAMANAVMMYDLLGVPKDDPRVVIAKESIRKLLVVEGDRAYCQPCLSPVWDTGLALHALLEAGVPGSEDALVKAGDWLKERQILECKGDWTVRRPDVRPGGWAFQYNNDYYPDVDDTAVVVGALDRIDHDRYREAIDRGLEWIEGMQSSDGGWGAFEPENTHFHLNAIPFADHGALLDPPTADVSARCISVMATLMDKQRPSTHRAINYLLKEQEKDGSWFGRWGTNYIYGTWSALCALNAAGIDHKNPAFRKAVDWLLSKQREDGGWGEDGRSYWDDQPRGEGPVSTPSQTAWAILGLMAAGEVKNPAVARGIKYLTSTMKDDGTWDEKHYNAVGFPRVFYLSYHGYRQFFPLWAMSRYRNLLAGNSGRVLHGL